MRRAVLETLAEEDLVAIPSTYRGASAKSRLEVRWMIFLDSLGIPWEYERCVWIDGRRRYPDLWLSEQQVWCEIKPAHTPVNLDRSLAIAEATGSPTLWISGPPRFGGYFVSLCDWGGLDVLGGLQFALGRRDKSALWLAAPDLSACLPLPPREFRMGDDVPRTKCERLKQAYLAAMSWRFD